MSHFFWHVSGKPHNMKKEDVQLLREIFVALGYPLQEGNAAAKPLQILYRTNTDGTLRWVWPANQRKPQLLKFYNTSSARARMIAWVIRLCFRLGLQSLFASGKATIWMRSGHHEQFVRANQQNWAIFSGTAGMSRTAVFYANDLFHKIPLGENALAGIIHEYRQHRHWNFFAKEYFEIAQASLKGVVLTQNDIARNGSRSATLTTLHWNVISELSQKGNCSVSLAVMPQFVALKEKINVIEQAANPHIPPGFVKKLRMLLHSIDSTRIIPAGYSHGDFTPWNMFVKGNKLALIDWEMADPCAPLLFDAFHFVLQQGVLVDHLDYKTLKQQLDDAFLHPAAQQLIQENEVDTELHYALYILFTAAAYCSQYAQEESWPQQYHQSLRAWSDGLDDLLVQRNLLTPRQAMVTALFDYLHNKNYAALKWMAADPLSLSEEADIDICAAAGIRREFRQWIRNHFLAGKVHRQHKSFMDNYGVWLKDQSFLSVDMIFRIKRKQLVMMDAAPLLNSTVRDAAGVKVPSPEQDFTYVWLFHLLNNASLPQRYCQHFGYRSLQMSKAMNENFTWKNSLPIRNYRELFHFNAVIRHKVVQQLHQVSANRGIQGMRNRLLYLLDTVRGVFARKGFIITFSGVDGAGKSTVIGKVQQQIEKRFRRKTVVLRHRPALLPMLSAWKEGRKAAEARAASVLPRQGRNKNTVSSLLRFAYYYLDYLAGQFAVQLRYVWRGYVVIYDRYYFDFIHDSKRSNIQLPAWLTRPLYTLLLKPSCNFFLYATPDTILRRKQELDKTTIQSLTQQYLSLFTRLSGKYRRSTYVAVENEDLPVTLDIILNHIKRKSL